MPECIQLQNKYALLMLFFEAPSLFISTAFPEMTDTSICPIVGL